MIWWWLLWTWTGVYRERPATMSESNVIEFHRHRKAPSFAALASDAVAMATIRKNLAVANTAIQEQAETREVALLRILQAVEIAYSVCGVNDVIERAPYIFQVALGVRADCQGEVQKFPDLNHLRQK